MHRRILIWFVTFIYYCLTTYGLYRFDAGLLVTTLFFFALPAYILARQTKAPVSVILAVAFLGGGLAALFEAIAGLYGLWYTVSSDATRFFGLVSLEAMVALMIQTIFFVLLYEYLFDDGQYTARNSRQRFVFFLVFFAAALALVALHTLVLPSVYLEHSYLWIIGSIIAACFTLLALHKTPTLHFFDRVLDFSVLAAIPTLLALWLGVENVHRVYAYPEVYLGTLTVFGATIPFDEILIALALPLLVSIVYEVYLDDRY